MSDETPRLHIDSDWKAQAQAEKDRLAAKESARAQQPRSAPPLVGQPEHADQGDQGEPGEPGEMPPADFRGLIMTLGSQAMMGLGAYTDPQSGRVMIDLAGAQFAIDLLGVVEEKSRGNLAPDEVTEITEVLAQLRARFVHVAKMIHEQMQREAGNNMGMMGGGSDIAGSIGRGSGHTSPSGLIIPD